MHVGTDLVPIFAECLNKPAMKKLPDSYFTTGIQLLYIIVIPIYAFFFLIGFKPFHIDILMGVDMGQLAFRAAIMASIELVCALFSRMTMLLVRDRLKLNYNQFFTDIQRMTEAGVDDQLTAGKAFRRPNHQVRA